MSGAVQKIEISQPSIPAPLSETASIMHMIERVARDPSVDLERMRELLAMRNAMVAEAAKEAFNNAIAAAQSEMRSVVADASNPQTKSKYASYHAVDKALRPVYTKHGLALTFDTGKAEEEGYVRVLCTVALGKYERTHHIDMPADGKGAKGGDVMTKTHAVGSAISYARRYLLLMIFNVAIGENDDDGNAAGRAAGETITDEQVDELNRLLIDTKSNLALFLKAIKLESLTQIGADKFEAVKKLIVDTAAKRAAREGATS